MYGEVSNVPRTLLYFKHMSNLDCIEVYDILDMLHIYNVLDVLNMLDEDTICLIC